MTSTPLREHMDPNTFPTIVFGTMSPYLQHGKQTAVSTRSAGKQHMIRFSLLKEPRCRHVSSRSAVVCFMLFLPSLQVATVTLDYFQITSVGRTCNGFIIHIFITQNMRIYIPLQFNIITLKINGLRAFFYFTFLFNYIKWHPGLLFGVTVSSEWENKLKLIITNSNHLAHI